MENKYYNRELASILKEHNVKDDQGLSSKEAKKRLELYGQNLFTKMKEKSLLQEIKETLSEQLMIILLIAAGISLLIKEYHDAIGICFAVLLSTTIGILTESRSKKAAHAIAKHHKIPAVRSRKGKTSVPIGFLFAAGPGRQLHPELRFRHFSPPGQPVRQIAQIQTQKMILLHQRRPIFLLLLPVRLQKAQLLPGSSQFRKQQTLFPAVGFQGIFQKYGTEILLLGAGPSQRTSAAGVFAGRFQKGFPVDWQRFHIH